MNVCPYQFCKLAPGSDSVGFYVTKAEFFPWYREKSSIPDLHFFYQARTGFRKSTGQVLSWGSVTGKDYGRLFYGFPQIHLCEIILEPSK